MQSVLTTALLGLFLLSGQGVSGIKGLAAVSAKPTYTVTLTGYNALLEQTDDDPTTTASGATSNPEVIAARSRDLADVLPFGTVIEISAATSTGACGFAAVQPQIGLRVIADLMHPRKRQHIDILLPYDDNRNLARILGYCDGVEIRVVGSVDIARMPRNQAELKKAIEKQNLALAK